MDLSLSHIIFTVSTAILVEIKPLIVLFIGVTVFVLNVTSLVLLLQVDFVGVIINQFVFLLSERRPELVVIFLFL